MSKGGGFDKNVIIFVSDNSSSTHIDNGMKDFVVLGRVPFQPKGSSVIL